MVIHRIVPNLNVTATAAEDSVLSINVSDVDAAYARAQQLGYENRSP